MPPAPPVPGDVANASPLPPPPRRPQRKWIPDHTPRPRHHTLPAAAEPGAAAAAAASRHALVLLDSDPEAVASDSDSDRHDERADELESGRMSELIPHQMASIPPGRVSASTMNSSSALLPIIPPHPSHHHDHHHTHHTPSTAAAGSHATGGAFSARAHPDSDSEDDPDGGAGDWHPSHAQAYAYAQSQSHSPSGSQPQSAAHSPRLRHHGTLTQRLVAALVPPQILRHLVAPSSGPPANHSYRRPHPHRVHGGDELDDMDDASDSSDSDTASGTESRYHKAGLSSHGGYPNNLQLHTVVDPSCAADLQSDANVDDAVGPAQHRSMTVPGSPPRRRTAGRNGYPTLSLAQLPAGTEANTPTHAGAPQMSSVLSPAAPLATTYNPGDVVLDFPQMRLPRAHSRSHSQRLLSTVADGTGHASAPRNGSASGASRIKRSAAPRQPMRLTYRLILFSVGCIFLFKLIWSLATTLPEAPPGSPPLTWPSHLADLKAQADLMRLYAREHFYHVLALFTTIYLAKQTLLIPGSALANLAGGIMYGPWAILYVSFLTAIGSAFCYGLSYWLFGEAFFERIMGKRMAYFRRMIDEQSTRSTGNSTEAAPSMAYAHHSARTVDPAITSSGSLDSASYASQPSEAHVVRAQRERRLRRQQRRDQRRRQQHQQLRHASLDSESSAAAVVMLTDAAEASAAAVVAVASSSCRTRLGRALFGSPQLFQYLMFIRLFPFSPNWFLNLASPFAGVPIGPFAMTAFLGLMPYNTVCVQAAATLSEVESFAQILNGRVVAELCLVSGLALLPAVLGGRVRTWLGMAPVAAASLASTEGMAPLATSDSMASLDAGASLEDPELGLASRSMTRLRVPEMHRITTSSSPRLRAATFTHPTSTTHMESPLPSHLAPPAAPGSTISTASAISAGSTAWSQSGLADPISFHNAPAASLVMMGQAASWPLQSAADAADSYFATQDSENEDRLGRSLGVDGWSLGGGADADVDIDVDADTATISPANTVLESYTAGTPSAAMQPDATLPYHPTEVDAILTTSMRDDADPMTLGKPLALPSPRVVPVPHGMPVPMPMPMAVPPGPSAHV